MKALQVFILLLTIRLVNGQAAEIEQRDFCKGLRQVFESGRKENFESINGITSRQSSLLIVPGYSIKLDPFVTIYTDKDRRFVGKTMLEMDSLSAVKKMGELQSMVNHCIDSAKWVWVSVEGDDSTTVFFKEIRELRAVCADLRMDLAMDRLTANLFTVNLYIKRN